MPVVRPVMLKRYMISRDIIKSRHAPCVRTISQGTLLCFESARMVQLVKNVL